MKIADLFEAAGLAPQGLVGWGTPIDVPRPGVYVVALVEDSAEHARFVNVDSLSATERKRWNAGQPIIYIGRATRSIRGRLAQFYRHKYGEKAPHRGGQAVIPLECKRWVYWATTDSPIKAERQMIDAFRAKVGALPYANRRR